MRFFLPYLILSMCVSSVLADEEVYRFDPNISYKPAGLPNIPPTILAVSEKPLKILLNGFEKQEMPEVNLYRITAARRVPIDSPWKTTKNDDFQWTWTTPKVGGPSRYEVHFGFEPAKVIKIEIRAQNWLKETLEILRGVEWKASGLSADELAVLRSHGLKIKHESSSDFADHSASLQMFPRHGSAPRRRVIWNEHDPALVVWRSGAVSTDIEIRAPRWWISPESLATDQGLIRFLDLFSEPPHNP